MRSLPLLISLFLLLAFISHPAFTAVVVISEAEPRLKTDPIDEPDPLENEEVVEDMDESEMASEPNEDDESESGLMPAGPRLTPLVYRCFYDFRTGKKRCYPRTKLILLRR